jgi:hypothetical protein
MFQVLHTMKLYATNTYGDYAMQVCLPPMFPLEVSCTCAAPRLYQRARGCVHATSVGDRVCAGACSIPLWMARHHVPVPGARAEVPCSLSSGLLVRWRIARPRTHGRL